MSVDPAQQREIQFVPSSFNATACWDFTSIPKLEYNIWAYYFSFKIYVFIVLLLIVIL